MTNLMQLRAAMTAELAHRPRIGYQDIPNVNNPKGTFMKCASVVKAAAAVVIALGLAACTDIKPLQADIADLKSQLAKAQGDIAAAKSSADQANSAAQSAGQAASGAQSTANQALAAAHASQSCCDATNEKIDRMFKRSVSK
jgi:murein lipoprotein